MQLKPGLSQLAFPYAPAPLCAEIAHFPLAAWVAYPNEALGDRTLSLVSAGGTPNIDYALAGTMAPTPWLQDAPGFQQLLSRLATPLSRTRLLRLSPHTVLPLQREVTYHGFRRKSILLPLQTNPAVCFLCGTETQHLPAGTAWLFDQTQPHSLANHSEEIAFHLLIETKGSAALDALLTNNAASDVANQALLHWPPINEPLCLEPYLFEVLTPAEFGALTQQLFMSMMQLTWPSAERTSLQQQLATLQSTWAETFARYGHHAQGELSYRDRLADFEEQIAAKFEPALSAEQTQAHTALAVIRSMLWMTPPATIRKVTRPNFAQMWPKADQPDPDFQCPTFEEPLFILSAPRAGSTLLFELLRQFPDLWTIGEENHAVIDPLPTLNLAAHHFHSHRLTAEDATPAVAATVRTRFARRLQDWQRQAYLDLPREQRPNRLRFLEKTPKNALRIPFLNAVFPGARYIYLYREPKETISSIVEGWRQGNFTAPKPPPGWPYRHWSFFLVPGWETLQHCSLVEIAAYQWQMANEFIWADLQQLPRSAWCFISYETLVRQPQQTMRQIAEFAHLHWDAQTSAQMARVPALSSTTLSAPAPDKWRKHALELAAILPDLAPLINKIEKSQPSVIDQSTC